MVSAVVYRAALEHSVSTILCSTNLYEASDMYLNGPFKLRFVARRLFRLSPTRFVRSIFCIGMALLYLLRLKLEFSVPPVTNLVRYRPKMPKGIRGVNVTRYASWDVDKMVQELERDVGWKRPREPKLPMRFDCRIEASLVNHTFKKSGGLTTHGMMCNNLIYDGTRTKADLRETVEEYDRLLPAAMREILRDLE